MPDFPVYTGSVPVTRPPLPLCTILSLSNSLSYLLLISPLCKEGTLRELVQDSPGPSELLKFITELSRDDHRLSIKGQPFLDLSAR